MGYAFATAVGAAETASCNPPNGVAIKTTIVDKVPLLEALSSAIRTNAAFVQPVAVSIKAILDMVFVDSDAQVLGQAAGPLPGSDFQLE